jgi:hypothetical protein
MNIATCRRATLAHLVVALALLAAAPAGAAPGQTARYHGAIAGCQAQANVERRTVTCLVPIIDWNPKTWEDCNA